MTDPMRVGLDVTPLIGPPSGIHQVTRKLLDALVRAGVDVSGWMLSARGRRPTVAIPVRRSRVPARLAQWGWSRGGFPPGRLVTGPVDVVHGTNFLAPPSPRSVISVQDLTPITRPDWVRPEVAAMAEALQTAVARGAWVHASSRAVADEALEVLGASPDRTAVVHHAVEPLLGGDADRGRRHSGGSRYVLVLGTVEPRKNVPSLVSTIAGIPDDVHLVVAGPAGADDDRLSDAVRRAGCVDRLHRLFDVSDATRADLVAGADVVAFPSRHEGFGLPPLEAIASGVPVVATAVGALPELVGDLVDLVPPGDDDAFSEALTIQLDAPETSPAARDLLLSYTWDDVASQMIGLYRRMVDDEDGGADGTDDDRDQAGGEPASR